MAGIRTCNRESQVQRPNHYTTEPPRTITWSSPLNSLTDLLTLILVCDQPPRSTQPGHPFMCRCNEYQPNGGDALRLGSKGRYGSCVGGRSNCVIPLLNTGHIWTVNWIDKELIYRVLYKFSCLLTLHCSVLEPSYIDSNYILIDNTLTTWKWADQWMQQYW